MTEQHLQLEQLLALREPGAEPGAAAARQHLESCPQCRAEAGRLDQLASRMRALPVLRPTRDRWPAVRAGLDQDRRRIRRRRFGLAGLGLIAAALAGVVVVTQLGGPGEPVAAPAVQNEIANAKQHSQALEQVLDQYHPESRITDGRTDRIAEELENRIAEVDRRLQAADLLDEQQRSAAALQLWRERVGLLDALMDVHVTHASNVGL